MSAKPSPCSPEDTSRFYGWTGTNSNGDTDSTVPAYRSSTYDAYEEATDAVRVVSNSTQHSTSPRPQFKASPLPPKSNPGVTNPIFEGNFRRLGPNIQRDQRG
ncbi:hypothetical protein N7448_011356 [Penicillium atrosanguineum]|uniref:Uncharacterized protein n=1 Tax=Penicillium atrosanguineum TaxID=1132637 RepID=A0A9W9KTN7_9EURO|nr:hypothetical protein N7526_011531 [Penicillium atrosanguineum]KAJ5117724.1 hypothetical protein N7448_011356 [Penicillium atrosanguineum]KAJ5318385.1 hypothetical protein N7476_004805 [Penicillium atrosanguineum]KAJ5318670.1 hypothetical protein N7476_005090 [Penicillium atrosanguineum]